MHSDGKSRTAKRLTASMAMIVVLSVCLAITSFALVYSMVSVDGNLFQTGQVRIDLNGGVPVIRENEFLFEPGMTVKKDFYLKNDSTCDVYYRLFFQNVSGGLADVVQIRICDGDRILFSGTPASMEQEKVAAADDVLKLGEIRQLQIYFHFPEAAGNSAQGLYMSFDFAAEAVQTKNNPNKEFD